MGLDVTGFGKVADVLGAVFDKVSHFIPDPVEKAKAQQALLELQQRDEFKQIDTALALSTAQTDINKIEAASSDPFTSRWRPAVGWVGVISLALVYWPKAIVLTVIWTWQASAAIHGAPDASHVAIPPFPDLGVTDLIGLVASLLGLGGMRTLERIKGVIPRGR